jgi:hypothetical protein
MFFEHMCLTVVICRLRGQRGRMLVECLPSRTSSSEYDDFINHPPKKQQCAEQDQQANLNGPKDCACKEAVPQPLKTQQKKVRSHNVFLLHPLHIVVNNITVSSLYNNNLDYNNHLFFIVTGKKDCPFTTCKVLPFIADVIYADDANSTDANKDISDGIWRNIEPRCKIIGQ